MRQAETQSVLERLRTLRSLWSGFPLYIEPGGQPINDEALLRDAVTLIDTQVALIGQLRDEAQAYADLIARQAEIIREQEAVIHSIRTIVEQAAPNGVTKLAASAA